MRSGTRVIWRGVLGAAAVVGVTSSVVMLGCQSISREASRAEPEARSEDVALRSEVIGGWERSSSIQTPPESSRSPGVRQGLLPWSKAGGTNQTPLPDGDEAVREQDRALPPEFILTPGQELWVIERPAVRDRWASRSANDDCPGSGTLMTRWQYPGEPAEREVPVPLAHTGVQAEITGPISSVTVTQQFHNPFSGKIEAVYVFPLPDDAAINDFVMTLDGRSIRGVIREREEAQRIYDSAKARGYHASLMSQERSNIFTQRVANIEPNQRVDVTITYFHTLGFRDGGYEFVFPMVVGPRYNPPSTMNGVAVAPYGAFASEQQTQVQYLRPGERSGRDISIDVRLDVAMPIESIESPTHQVMVSTDGHADGRASITLSPADSIPNRDFVLRYRLAGGPVKGGIITQRDDRAGGAGGGFFCLTLVPPEDLRYSVRGPVEMVFVIDCSGSMNGEPLRLAKRAAVNALTQLRPEDSFQVIRFADSGSSMTDRPLPATDHNKCRGVEYIERLTAGGGTEMLRGIEPALGFRSDWSRARFVCLISDGMLGNEPEVLKRLDRKLGDSRVFSVGIGSAPNRALLNAMARIGRGAAAYISSDRDADECMSLFIDRVSCAAMTDLRIDWGNLDVTEVFPKRIPDLYVGRPVVLYGRYRNATTQARHEVRVSGRIGERGWNADRRTIAIPMQAAGAELGGSASGERAFSPRTAALPLVWARQKIQQLDEYTGWGSQPGAGGTEGPNKREIRDLALRFGLMSAYTSFIAVDSSERTQGSFGTTVRVPENMPRGVRYDTTVGADR